MFRSEESDVATETVRYGRARLTIARSAPPAPLFEDFDMLLDSYERGKARASSVAAAFLRERVVDHTPSFEWRTARLTELIPIVCELSDEPKLKASTPTELADALVRARAIGRPRTAARARRRPGQPAGGTSRRRRFPFSLISR